jgi:hypothetical protein
MTAIQPAPVFVETLKCVSAKPHLYAKTPTAYGSLMAVPGIEGVPPGKERTCRRASDPWVLQRQLARNRWGTEVRPLARGASWTRKDVAQAVKAMRAVGSPRGFSLGNPQP